MGEGDERCRSTELRRRSKEVVDGLLAAADVIIIGEGVAVPDGDVDLAEPLN